jgi:hypothetical protein
MSEHGSSSEKPSAEQTITLIRDELNFIHGETHKARKFLTSTLAGFTEHCNTIDARLDRIEKLLLGTLATDGEGGTRDEKPAIGEASDGQSNETATKTDRKAGSNYKSGGYDDQAINETTTRTIANSKPDRVKREPKQPDRYAPEIKQQPAATKKPAATKSAKALTSRKPSEVRTNFPKLKPKKNKPEETLYEQDFGVEIPREVDSKPPIKKPTGKKGKSIAENASAAAEDQGNGHRPSKKKRKASETDEEEGPVPEEPKAMKAKKAKKS